MTRIPRRRAFLTGREGSALVETGMLLTVLMLLLVAMVQIARLTYIYYSLRKTVYSVASYLGNQQGVDFCDAADPTIAAAINFGLTGTTDGSQPIFINGLNATMISITPQQFDGTSISACPCGVPGCDTANGGTPPNFITVAIAPNSYFVPIRIPFLTVDPIPLQPEVKVPYGGT